MADLRAPYILALALLLAACQSSRIPDTDPEFLLDARDLSAARPQAAGPRLRAWRTLRRMSLDQKIGQRFICWIQGTEITPLTRRLVREAGVGGVIYYPWNVESREQVRDLSASLQAAARQNDPPVRLFICADQEGGRVAALKLGQVARFPAAWYWGEQSDPAYIRAAAYVTGRDLYSLGINMNFAPVLDLYGKADSTIIGDRSMGPDPERIGQYALQYLQGAKLAGIIPVFKHFPGHGSSTVDSHGALPVVDLDIAVLMERDFKPFRTAIAGGAEALMTAHVLFPRLDPGLPVTLSPVILRDFLRRDLRYSGVVVSDLISMGAISKNFSTRDTLRLLFQAGVDLILVHSKDDVFAMKAEVRALLEEGAITEAQIDEGARRILALKNRYGLLPPADRRVP